MSNGYAIVTPEKRITSERDFNDLVFEAILFESQDEGRVILEKMFPNKRITIDIARNGCGFVTVDDVAMRIWS